MVNRVVFGQRGSAYGLWISKPGFDVLTTADDNLLFNPNWQSMQVVQTGRVAVSANGSAAVSIPNLGYRPAIIINPEVNWANLDLQFITSVTLNAWATFSSNTAMTLHNTIQDLGSVYSGFMLYAVLRKDAHN